MNVVLHFLAGSFRPIEAGSAEVAHTTERNGVKRVGAFVGHVPHEYIKVGTKVTSTR